MGWVSKAKDESVWILIEVNLNEGAVIASIAKKEVASYSERVREP